jgi:hypothetical protein
LGEQAERLPGLQRASSLPSAGRISKEDADARADAEYEEFAARRRAFLEAEAESSAFKALEEQAKQVSPR